MEDVKTINVTFRTEVMIPMYELKLQQHWTWEDMIINSTNFFIEHHPLPSKKEEEPEEEMEEEDDINIVESFE